MQSKNTDSQVKLTLKPISLFYLLGTIGRCFLVHENGEI